MHVSVVMLAQGFIWEMDALDRQSRLRRWRLNSEVYHIGNCVSGYSVIFVLRMSLFGFVKEEKAARVKVVEGSGVPNGASGQDAKQKN